MKKTVLSIMVAATLLSSCKKDDKTPAPSSGSETFKTIADKKWQLSAYTYNYMGTDIDGYAVFPDCQKDNIWIMKSDKTNQSDEGPTKCKASDPQTTVAGSWELRSSDKELYVKDFGGAVYGINDMTFTILELTSTKLKLKYTTSVGGPSVVNTATYTAQ